MIIAIIADHYTFFQRDHVAAISPLFAVVVRKFITTTINYFHIFRLYAVINNAYLFYEFFNTRQFLFTL